MGTIRFHLDECMPVVVATGLRLRNQNCTTSQDAGLLGAADDEQLGYAHRESRVIVTSDDDFLRMANDGHAHSGIVFWTQKTTKFQLIKDLSQLSFHRTPHDIKNTVVYL
ncbi:MAG: DUF5615 family PIN-like protein [Planctomycetaceae bacterium]|nr:DUF5615 family PIN-like protein [Planctomycetaceae bacterium]